MKAKLVPLIVCSLLLPVAALAQTFEVNGQPSQPAQNSPNAKQKKGQQPNTADSGIGWGSSIEVGRLARAADSALHKGNPGAAADYAERAVKAAPRTTNCGSCWATPRGWRDGISGRSRLTSTACRTRPATPMA